MARLSMPTYRCKRVGDHEYAAVTLRDAVSGRRRDVILGDYGSPASRQRYAQVIADWEAAGRQLAGESPINRRSTPHGITVGELALAYIEHCERTLPRGDLAMARSAIRVLLEQHLDTPVDQFGPNALRLVRQAMIAGQRAPADAENGQPAGGLNSGEQAATSPPPADDDDGDDDDDGPGWIRRPWRRSTVCKGIGRIRQMFRWGVARELLRTETHAALQALEPLRAGRSEVRESDPVGCAPDDAVQAVLAIAPATIRDMIQLQLLTGMRPGELCAMRRCDIDTSGACWQYTPVIHKTQHLGRRRIIVLGPRAQAILEPRLEVLAPAAHVFSARRSEANRQAERHARRQVPLNQGNRPGVRRRPPGRVPRDEYTPHTYRQAIRRLCDRANAAAIARMEAAGRRVPPGVRLVASWRPHQLRHSYLTAVRREFGLEAAQVVADHASAQLTDAVYAERDVRQKLRVAAKIG